MSPPPMEATRCQPSGRAIAVTTDSSTRFGSMTKKTVRTAKASSAPRLSRLCAGSISGLLLIRPDSFRKATIEPVKVTAPMKTPITTSAEWMPSRLLATSVCPASAFDGQVAVPADQHRREADEAVQHRDQLGHAGH